MNFVFHFAYIVKEKLADEEDGEYELSSNHFDTTVLEELLVYWKR